MTLKGICEFTEASVDHTLKACLQVQPEADSDLLLLRQIHHALDPRDVQKSGTLGLIDPRFAWRLPAAAPRHGWAASQRGSCIPG